MKIQQQKPQLLSMLYETIKATTTAAVTTTIKTIKENLINNHNNCSENNLTSTKTTISATSTTTTLTTTTYELLHMSRNTKTGNLLSKKALHYISAIPCYSSKPYLSPLESKKNFHLTSSSTSFVVDLIDSLTSFKNLTNKPSTSIEISSLSPSLSSSLPLNGNFTWNSTATATTITISSRTASNIVTLPSFLDSYLVGMAWSKALVVAIFLLLILVTMVGNTLVILAVLTTRRLRTVTNCFVLNLAITDWLVGTCVMPPAVIHYIGEGVWRFGWILCDIWISLDVLLCTASILSLCAISLDRYLAVTQPLTYSKNRRTKRLALFMIFIVWVTALSITCPPYLGWYEPGRRKEGYTVCRYNQNKGYVVFSAMGSFFIPLAVMLYVYLKIGYVLTSRHQRIVRDANSERIADHEIDCDNFASESEHFHCVPQKLPSFKSRWTIDGSVSTGNSKTNSLKCSKCNKNYIDQSSLKHNASIYELVEVSRFSMQRTILPPVSTCTSINYGYGDDIYTPMSATTNVTFSIGDSMGQKILPLPRQQLHCADSNTSSFSESCLPQTISQFNKYSSNCQQNLNSQNGHHHHHHRIPLRVSTTKRDTKTAKTLTMVMGGFIACWLPFFVYYILIPFLPPAVVSEGLMSFLTWVGWVNCAINPFIYAFYNPDFRTAFWRLTCKQICKQKSSANHMTVFRR